MIGADHLRTLGEAMQGSRTALIQDEGVDHPELHSQEKENDS